MPIGLISVGSVELAGIALGCHTIALDVAQMSARCPQLPRLELCDPRLDDYAALATGIKASGGECSKGTAPANS